MNLRSAVTPFCRAIFRYHRSWPSPRPTLQSCCTFQSYEFSKSSEEEEKARDFFRRFGGRRDHYWKMFSSVVDFATVKACPAIVHVSSEKGDGGSGVIVDSEGTVLTSAYNVFPLGKINVSLPDGRKFSGAILQANKDYDLALLKIQSEMPLPITTLGSLKNYNGDYLISIEYPFRRWIFPRPSSENEVDKEGHLMQSYEESKYVYNNFFLGSRGGPIVSFDGEVVGISTRISMIQKASHNTWHGSIEAMPIEETLYRVGYAEIGGNAINLNNTFWKQWQFRKPSAK